MTANEGTQRGPLLVTSNPDQADQWAATLEDAGVDVLVEITDAQTGDPGSSPLIGVLGVRPPEFVHLLMVPAAQRDRAISALVNSGWDGREGLRMNRTPDLRRLGIAALWTVAGIAAFILIRIALA